MIVKELTTLGFSGAEADLLDYIYLNPNCSVKDICRDTNFKQPEVCIIVNKLKEYLKEEKHTQSRGRPYITYKLSLFTLYNKKNRDFNIYRQKFLIVVQSLKDLDTKH